MNDLDGVRRSLAESAYALARSLDSGARGMGAAAVARELRETLRTLMEKDGDDDDETKTLIDRLSTPVQHPKKSRPSDARGSGGGGRRSARDSANAVATSRRGRGVGGRP